MEMFLRFNLGPLHKLEGLVAEVLAFDSSKRFFRKETRMSKLISKDVNKSASIATFEKKDESKSRLPDSFWDSCPTK